VQVVEIKIWSQVDRPRKVQAARVLGTFVDPSSLEQNQRCDDAVAGDSSGNGNDD
jgi:hypothetical protein